MRCQRARNICRFAHASTVANSSATKACIPGGLISSHFTESLCKRGGNKMATIRVIWDGRVFIPFGRSLPACEKLEKGEPYNMQLEADWSVESHNHFFARLTELYDNLPENIAACFRNIDHFRAWCLIREGFCTEICQIEPSPALAQHAAKIIGKVSPYCVVHVDGSIVRVWTAKSQARSGGMSKKEFERSKQAVLELAEFLVAGGELEAA